MENITNKQIIEHVKTMTAVQLKELVELIETTFGVTAAVATAPAATQEIATTPTTVSVILKEVEFEKRMAVIKLVKTILGAETTLVAAKKIVDAVTTGPQKILENIDVETATKHEAELKAAGAVVEVK